MAHYWYSQLLMITGRFPEAVSESERARDLDPSSSIINMNVGRALYFARDFTRAIEHLNKMLEDDPRDIRARYVIGYVYQQAGRYNEALKIFEEGYSSDKILWAGPLGFTYGRMGRTQDALRILKELEELSKDKNVHPHEKALIYIGLKDRDNSLKLLEQSYDDRFHSMPFLASEPIYDDLRTDARYLDLVRRLELPQAKTINSGVSSQRILQQLSHCFGCRPASWICIESFNMMSANNGEMRCSSLSTVRGDIVGNLPVVSKYKIAPNA